MIDTVNLIRLLSMRNVFSDSEVGAIKKKLLSDLHVETDNFPIAGIKEIEKRDYLIGLISFARSTGMALSDDEVLDEYVRRWRYNY